ncbi:DUF6355 family natural product biosynthesis protein [Allokutzneria oryzae]|uniref:DUF6355 family natural product biosynthesis protein n=1 Tax=Allokutzneria oryzae TaxID=1378989 RepID=A0ABV5ZWX8_9PSEU
MRSLSAAFVLSASAVGLVGTTHVAEAGPSSHPCGYHVITNNAYYNHCGSGNVLIHIEKLFGDEEKCVSPGNTPIGLQPFTHGAYYLRPC